MFSSLYIFFTKHFLSIGGIKRARNYQLLFLPYILYSDIFQLYIELTVAMDTFRWGSRGTSLGEWEHNNNNDVL